MKNLFSVNDDFVNSRLDRWLRRNICKIPQSLIEKNLRKGRVKVNNKKEKSSYKLQKNDKIDLYNFNFFQRVNKKIKFREQFNQHLESASRTRILQVNPYLLNSSLASHKTKGPVTTNKRAIQAKAMM